MFEIGKLYRCQEHYLLIYPTINVATACRATLAVASQVKSWSLKMNCKIQYSIPNELFMIADQKKINNQVYVKILCGDKLGWIIWKNGINLRRQPKRKLE